MKRFYKNVSYVTCGDDGYIPLLDGKLIKTPLKNDLLCPTESLCQKIVDEWDAQKDEIDQSKMLFTQFVTTQIDKVSHENHYHKIRSGFSGFIDGDLITYFNQDDLVLYEQQKKNWLPLINATSEHIGIDYHVQKTFDIVPQDQNIHSFWQAWFLQFEGHHLNIIQLFLSLVPSPILCFLFINDDIDHDLLSHVVHLEEIRQQEEWGIDPVNAEKQAQFKREIAALSVYRDAIISS